MINIRSIDIFIMIGPTIIAILVFLIAFNSSLFEDDNKEDEDKV